MAPDVSLCLKCEDNFVVNNKVIKCVLCENKFHAVCVSVKDAVYKALSENNSNIAYICEKCSVGGKKNINKVTKDEQSKEAKTSDEITLLKGQIDDMEKKYIEKKKTIEGLQKENENLRKEVKKVAGKTSNNEASELHKLEKEKLEMEIGYLKSLTHEMEDKNLILKENNSLLLERINRKDNQKSSIGTHQSGNVVNMIGADASATSYKNAVEKDAKREQSRTQRINDQGVQSSLNNQKQSGNDGVNVDNVDIDRNVRYQIRQSNDVSN